MRSHGLCAVLCAALFAIPTNATAVEFIIRSNEGINVADLAGYGQVIDSIPSIGTYLIGADVGVDQDDLQDVDGVDGVEENERYETLECQQSFIWLLNFVPPPLAEVPSPRPDAPRVAFVDSAWDANHIVFRKQKRAGRDLLDPSGDASLSEETLRSFDALQRAGNQHGTAVASALAAVSPDFWVAPYRVMDEDCNGTTFDLVRAIVHAVDDGHSVVLMAVGSSKKMRSLEMAVDYATEHDVLIVASAGNEGKASKPSAAFYGEIMIVAAVDSAGQPATFTNHNKTIAISDYGVDLEIAFPANGRAVANGTSFAAARTAGAAAAVRAAYPALTAVEVREILCDSARPFPELPSKYRKKLGCGITDLNAALALAESYND